MKRPQPVLTTAGFTSLATSVAGIATWLGYGQATDKVSGTVQGIGAAVIFLLSLIHPAAASVAASKVTPIVDPRTSDGTPLVPASPVDVSDLDRHDVSDL